MNGQVKLKTNKNFWNEEYGQRPLIQLLSLLIIDNGTQTNTAGYLSGTNTAAQFSLPIRSI